MVCDFTSHHNEKCETILNEGWCVTLPHITMRSVRLYSMKGGVMWCDVVCDFTSHHSEKCETTFNVKLQHAL